ncbi:hypothetical protein [Streptomyces xanthochromogenes]
MPEEIEYRVTLRFDPDSKAAVYGYWRDLRTAERKYRARIGESGSHPTAVITLSEHAPDGTEHVLKTWTRAAGETDGPATPTGS